VIDVPFEVLRDRLSLNARLFLERDVHLSFELTYVRADHEEKSGCSADSRCSDTGDRSAMLTDCSDNYLR
jgi:hypothetical protein